MNIYTRKVRRKYVLFFCAIAIGIGSLWYTNNLVEKLANEERKKIELWADATRLITTNELSSELSSESLDFLLKIITNNKTIPVIWIDEKDNIIGFNNIDTTNVKDKKAFFAKKLQEMRETNPPIEIPFLQNEKQYLFYSLSTILQSLVRYPYIQLSVIILFILAAYFAFSSSRKAEQNQVWVGLSKETAHQLGTPISSLLAWIEVLKLRIDDDEMVQELEKDISRLEKITERFSKIGSKPKLKEENVSEVVDNVLKYLRPRSSNKIIFKFDSPNLPVIIPLNPPLFEWVIENTCKNAMDAIEGKGNIEISITDNSRFIFIDIKDSGKGISRSKFKTIFKPGFTTKDRGWGLGLSLTKRIVEEYHNGKIFVADSEIGKGTTIRIILNRISDKE